MATTDLLTVKEAKQALALSESDAATNAEIGQLITAVTARIDSLCGPVVARTVTSESHDGTARNGQRKHLVRLREAPVVSITAVVEYSNTTAQTLSAESNTSKTANNYLYDSSTELLRRRASGSDSSFPHGRQNVVVTYSAGRVGATGSVSSEFKEAAAIICKHLWRIDHGSGTQTFGDVPVEVFPSGFAIPARALDLLRGELRPPGVA
jgi:hypothetical protein